MYLTHSTILALISTPLVVLAQSANPFKIPSEGLAAKGGQPLDLSWEPTTDGTVTLILRSGKSDNLAEGTIIACEFPVSLLTLDDLDGS